MNILVTGGAGFIGSNFLRYILKNKPDVTMVNLDKLTYAGNLENLKDIEQDPRYEFVKGDIANHSQVDNLFKTRKFNTVINFAAESHVDKSILDPYPFIETNIKGTQVLLEASKKHGVDRFVQVSSDEVYGSLNSADPPFTEENPIIPNSPYAASKAAADLMVRAYHETYGLNVVITRCSNNYGPYQFPEKLIPLMITNALDNKPLPVYGDGKNVRDWIHVEDHCSAIALAMEKGKNGAVYNIGADCQLKNIDVVKGILVVLGKPASLITYVQDRLGHDRRYAINSSKLQNELGWIPQHKFMNALPALAQWYIDNEDWWRRIKAGDNQKRQGA